MKWTKEGRQWKDKESQLNGKPKCRGINQKKKKKTLQSSAPVSVEVSFLYLLKMAKLTG